MGAIERAGVLVLRIPIHVEGLDGFSSWVGLNHDIPVICVLAGSKGYRPRFTLGEELCHLIKHNPLRCTVAEADEEAHRFVGELLLPEDVIRDEITEPITLSSLWPHRQRHMVSVQFLIRRLFNLEMITPNQYKYLNMQISTRGWKKEEPGDSTIVQEQPKMLPKMIDVVYGKPADFQRIKRDTGGVPIPLLRFLLGSTTSDDPEPNRKILAFQRRAS
jgi:Zn-dependent peptidase ImmA (M78 family)